MPFRFRVKTDNAGTSSNVQFTLPLRNIYTYNFHIDWGDETDQDVTTNTNITHTYSEIGEYDISITESAEGGFPTIYFNAGGDMEKVINLLEWGTNRWSSIEQSFFGCLHMIISATDHATAHTHHVQIADYAFAACRELVELPAIDLSEVITANYAWSSNYLMTTFSCITLGKCVYFNNAWQGSADHTVLASFANVNISSGQYFNSTWQNNTEMTSFPLLDFSSAISLQETWSGCTGLTSFPLINTLNVTLLNSAWAFCSGLTSFPLINTANVTDFRMAWRACTGITSFPAINTSKGTNFFETWVEMLALISFPVIDTSKGTDFTYCFYHWLSARTFPQLDFSSAITMTYAWGDGGFTSFPSLIFPVAITFIDTWNGCTSLHELDIHCPKMTDGTRMLSGVTLTPRSYSTLLKNLSIENTSSNVPFHGGNSYYLKAYKPYRDVLVARGWTITDGGMIDDYRIFIDKHKSGIYDISVLLKGFNDVELLDSETNESINVSEVLVNTSGYIVVYGKGYQKTDAKRIYLLAGRWHKQTGISGFVFAGTTAEGIYVRG